MTKYYNVSLTEGGDEIETSVFADGAFAAFEFAIEVLRDRLARGISYDVRVRDETTKVTVKFQVERQ